jgi:hypothetical protein
MVPARAVLYFLSFSGFLVSFMMRTDINIAMIAMARLPPPSPYAVNASSTPMYCYDPANITDELAADNVTKVVWHPYLSRFRSSIKMILSILIFSFKRSLIELNLS